MKNLQIKRIIAIGAAFTFISYISFAQTGRSISNSNKTTLSIETDPATFAFKGYAFHFRVKPRTSKHLLLGVGTYSLEMPDFLINMNPDNKDNNWNVKINSAYSLFGEYYFNELHSRWYVGLQAGVQNFKISNGFDANKHAEYSNFLIMPSIGYTWKPFKFPIYFKPWAGLGYTSKITGSSSVNELTYQISPLIPFATLHLGYTF